MKYQVTATATRVYEVEADSPEEAEETAKGQLYDDIEEDYDDPTDFFSWDVSWNAEEETGLQPKNC